MQFLNAKSFCFWSQNMDVRRGLGRANRFWYLPSKCLIQCNEMDVLKHSQFAFVDTRNFTRNHHHHQGREKTTCHGP